MRRSAEYMQFESKWECLLDEPQWLQFGKRCVERSHLTDDGISWDWPLWPQHLFFLTDPSDDYLANVHRYTDGRVTVCWTGQLRPADPQSLWLWWLWTVLMQQQLSSCPFCSWALCWWENPDRSSNILIQRCNHCSSFPARLRLPCLAVNRFP